MEEITYASGKSHQGAEQIFLSTSVFYLGEHDILLFPPLQEQDSRLTLLKTSVMVSQYSYKTL